MAEEYHITHVFIGKNPPVDMQEKAILEKLIHGAIQSGELELPDRHPGAKKIRQFEISFIRDDTKEFNFPKSDITMYIKEKGLEYGC